MPLLNEHAKELIDDYNRNPRCKKRYNPAAEAVYQERRNLGDPLKLQFEPHIIVGLKSFDMGRTMVAGFDDRLRSSLQAVRANPLIGTFKEYLLSSADLSANGSEIESVYDCLACPGRLHPRKQSHVAATKILHWLFPDLFLMLDSNVARAFRNHFGVRLNESTQPGYSAKIYLTCLKSAQNEIRTFGADRSVNLNQGRRRPGFSTRLPLLSAVALKTRKSGYPAIRGLG
jgi:hypothetical protein